MFDGPEVLLPLLAAAAGGGGRSPLGFHQGVIEAWDETDNTNTVRIQGNVFTDLKVLTTSDTIMLGPGDVVGILRFQTTYFVLGRISSPGAGDGLRIRTATEPDVTSTSSTSFVDLGGPTLSDVYIGSRRTCLVMASCQHQIAGCAGDMAFEVSGASTIAPEHTSVNWATYGTNDPDWNHIAQITAWSVLTAADGLQPGLNTFTARYKFSPFGPGTFAAFAVRTLVVFPL